MWRLLADENFNAAIVAGIRRLHADADIATIHDADLRGASDPEILTWCAEHDRILLSHDLATVPQYARDRVRTGMPMPGVIIVTKQSAIGRAITDLSVVIECSVPTEYVNDVAYLPFDLRA